MKSYDVAKLAGVSRSTVSRVINGYDNVPKETYDKVMAVVRKYNYEPNLYAQALTGKKTNTMGVFIVNTEGDRTQKDIVGNEFYSSYINYIVDAANSKELYLLVHSIYSENDYYKVKQAFYQKRIDSALIVGSDDSTSSVLELVGQGYALAIFDYDYNEVKKFSAEMSKALVMNIDDFGGTYQAVENLILYGHTKIGAFFGRNNTFSGRERERAFFQVLSDYNIEPYRDYCVNANFSRDMAFAAANNIMQNIPPPTAMFCCNDGMALGVLEAAAHNNIRVPDDMSVVGFDNVSVTTLYRPGLYTVSAPYKEMVNIAVNELVSYNDQKGFGVKHTVCGTQIVERESVKKLINS